MNVIKKELQKLGVRPSKKLGQNFLIDKKALAKIGEAADLSKDDVVIEAGPGLGTLTEALVSKCKIVHAFELDKKLHDYLLEKFRDCRNLSLKRKNILKVYPEQFGIAKYKFVSNLPYSIASRVLKHFLEEVSISPSQMTVLVQREVAERICAKLPKMSLLSFSIQLFAKPEICGIIKASSFWPKPEVDSAILRLNIRKKPIISGDLDKIFRLAKISFQFKRKKLKNCLLHSLKLKPESIEKLLSKAKIPPNSRASELNFTQWQSLYDDLLKQSR